MDKQDKTVGKEKKNSIMVLILVIHIVLFIMAGSVLVLFFASDFLGDEEIEKKEPDKLFESIKKGAISWLEKPQNATNEFEDEDRYSCNVSFEYAEEYAASAFEKFWENEVTVACFYDDGSSYSDGHVRVQTSRNLDDYKKTEGDTTTYSFYYSGRSVENMLYYWGGLDFSCSVLKFEIVDLGDGQSLLDIQIDYGEDTVLYVVE